MAFHIIEGKPGGGKSYYGAELMYEALTEGAVVHSNIELDPDVLLSMGWDDRYVFLDGSMSDWIKKKTEIVNGKEKKIWFSDVIKLGRENAENIVVLDEAGMEASADDQQKDSEKTAAMRGLISLSRHAGLEIYFLAQDREQMAKKFRRAGETITYCTNAAHVPILGWYISRFHGQHKRTIYVKGDEYGAYYLNRKPEICGFYRTDQMRDNLQMEQAGHRVKKTSAWTKKGMIGILGTLLFGLCAVGYGIYGGATMFTQPDKPKAKEAEESKTEEKSILKDGKRVTVEVPEKPKRPPAGMVELTWEAYDELVLAAVYKVGFYKKVLTRTGIKLYAGAVYEGQKVVSQWEYAGWHYFLTTLDRLIVVRPMREEERAMLPPVTVNSPAGKQQQGSTELLSGPLNGIQAMTTSLPFGK